MFQAVKHQGFTLSELLPDTNVLHLMMMHPLRVQVSKFLESNVLTSQFFTPGCLLRDHVRHVGKEWATNQRSGDDLHPVSLLQLHGGRRHVPITIMCYST